MASEMDVDSVVPGDSSEFSVCMVKNVADITVDGEH